MTEQLTADPQPATPEILTFQTPPALSPVITQAEQSAIKAAAESHARALSGTAGAVSGLIGGGLIGAF